MWLCIFAASSFAIATQGLDFVLGVSAPIIGFLYPPAITMILLTVVEPALARVTRFTWGFYVPVWTAVIYSALETLVAAGWLSTRAPLVAWAPLSGQGLGWVTPVLVGWVVGVGVGVVKRKPAYGGPHEHSPVTA